MAGIRLMVRLVSHLPPPSSTTTPHTHNTTQHHTQHTETDTERERERRQRKRRERQRKRRSPSQACFTIFRVLTCVSTLIPTYTHTQIHTYTLHKYIYYDIMNRQGHHNIRNGIVWVLTGHSTRTCTVSLHVIEL